MVHSTVERSTYAAVVIRRPRQRASALTPPAGRGWSDNPFVFWSVSQMEDQQVVSVVITSMPLRYSIGRLPRRPDKLHDLVLHIALSVDRADDGERHILRADAVAACRSGRWRPRPGAPRRRWADKLLGQLAAALADRQRAQRAVAGGLSDPRIMRPQPAIISRL